MHYFETRHFFNTTMWQVPRGYKARIVSGILYHVTGTTTVLSILGEGKAKYYGYIAQVDTATGTALFGLNDKVTTNFVHLLNTTDLWIPENMWIYLVGAATCYSYMILEIESIEE